MLNRSVKNIHKSYFEAGCSEYVLTAQPEDGLLQQMIGEQGWMCDCLKPGGCLVAEPKIAIACFFAKEMMEPTLIRWVQKICNLQKSFTITLNNFSSLPSNTIYLRIQDPEPIRDLAQQLKKIDSFIQSNNCPPVQLVTTPYLVIAEDIPAEVYDSVIYEFSARSFHVSFPVTRLALGKRKRKPDSFRLVNAFTLPIDFSAV